jgi:tRNA modification GTPase
VTIIAVGSPPGASPIGLVRISGGDAQALICSVVSLPNARGARSTRFTLGGIDLPCIVLWMPGPRSYTSEDVIELLLPGNPLLLARMVEDLIEHGLANGLAVGQAAPGEFTFRAWQAGRLSLAQAEAVMLLVHAQSEEDRAAARRAAQGALQQRTSAIADVLAQLLSLVEAGIDFVDEEGVVVLSAGECRRQLQAVQQACGDLMVGSSGVEAVDARPLVRLRGAPSAGKSTLFNALLGRTRAVTMDTPHTTRDELVEVLELPDGRVIRLADTPGTDHDPMPSSPSDLEVWCVATDTSPPLHVGACRIWTKGDLCAVDDDALVVCAIDGSGLDAVRHMIAESIRAQSGAAAAVAVSQRQRALLGRARSSMEQAQKCSETDSHDAALLYPEHVAAHLREALDRLGEVSGAITPDDVLGLVFSNFCIGK